MTYGLIEMPASDGRLRQDLDAWHLSAIDLPGLKRDQKVGSIHPLDKPGFEDQVATVCSQGTACLRGSRGFALAPRKNHSPKLGGLKRLADIRLLNRPTIDSYLWKEYFAARESVESAHAAYSRLTTPQATLVMNRVHFMLKPFPNPS